MKAIILAMAVLVPGMKEPAFKTQPMPSVDACLKKAARLAGDVAKVEGTFVFSIGCQVTSTNQTASH